MAKELKCPNCGAAAVPKEDGSLVCPTCGGTFTFKEGEARLAKAGEFDQVKADIEELKKRVPAGDALPPVGPDPGHVTDDGDLAEDDDEEEDEDDF
jgi:uncharacterized Zn finger protein (UPF0148 family)